MLKKVIVSLVSNKNELEELGKMDKLIKEVGNKVFELNENEKLIDQIEREEDAKYLYKKGIEDAKNDGLEQGLEQGIAQGLEQGKTIEKTNIIEKLLKKGMKPTEIAELLELSEEEVLKVQKEL